MIRDKISPNINKVESFIGKSNADSLKRYYRCSITPIITYLKIYLIADNDSDNSVDYRTFYDI